MDWLRVATDPDERERRLSDALKAFRDEGTVVEASEAKGARDLILARAFAHPRDKSIRFVESTHKYYLNGKQLPISVSGMWAKYFSHFDGDGVVSKNISRWRTRQNDKRFTFLSALEKLGVSEDVMGEMIKYAWKLNGEQQSSLGTALHRAIELRMNGLPIPEYVEVEEEPLSIDENTPLGTAMVELRNAFSLCNRDILRVLKSAGLVDHAPPVVDPQPRTDVTEYLFFERWMEKNPNLIPLRAEMNIFGEDLLLAGQVDMVMYDTESKQVVQIDWKRTKEMEYEAFGDRRGMYPFEKLPDSSYGHYVVQVRNAREDACPTLC